MRICVHMHACCLVEANSFENVHYIKKISHFEHRMLNEGVTVQA